MKGVCQKTDEVAGLQDYLVHAIEAMCAVGHRIIESGGELTKEEERFIAMGMFATLTNVNFSGDDMVEFGKRAGKLREEMRGRLKEEEKVKVKGMGKEFRDVETKEEMKKEGRKYLIPKRYGKLGKDRVCLQEMIIYGLKGVAAYIYHAIELGGSGKEVVGKMCKLMGETLQKETPSVEELLEGCMETGAMEELDRANTTRYGHPEPTRVQWIHETAKGSEKPGKAILVTGHDLQELGKLLEQCEGTGVQVYTHGEMLPCNAYPKLKAFKCLAGHIMVQLGKIRRKNLLISLDPIVLTTNCYIPAPESYVGRVFFNRTSWWDKCQKSVWK